MTDKDIARLKHILNTYGAEHYQLADPAYDEYWKFRERVVEWLSQP